jgi:hypothetical protein
LERIKRLQADGHTLLEIGRILSGRPAKVSARRCRGSARCWRLALFDYDARHACIESGATEHGITENGGGED